MRFLRVYCSHSHKCCRLKYTTAALCWKLNHLATWIHYLHISLHTPAYTNINKYADFSTSKSSWFKQPPSPGHCIVGITEVSGYDVFTLIWICEYESGSLQASSWLAPCYAPEGKAVQSLLCNIYRMFSILRAWGWRPVVPVWFLHKGIHFHSQTKHGPTPIGCVWQVSPHDRFLSDPCDQVTLAT